MSRSNFQHLRPSPVKPSPEDGQAGQTSNARPASAEGIFLASLVLIRKVVHGRLFTQPESDVSDIVQNTSLRLLKWRDKYREKSERMTADEWNSFTARTTHNEINRYCSSRMNGGEVSIEETHSLQDGSSEHEVPIEITSLVRKVWQGICSMSLYQRRSLLLHSSELLIYFLQCGIEEARILESLELTEEEWDPIAGRIPLVDAEIAQIARPGKLIRDRGSAARAVKKARCDARKKLKGLMR